MTQSSIYSKPILIFPHYVHVELVWSKWLNLQLGCTTPQETLAQVWILPHIQGLVNCSESPDTFSGKKSCLSWFIPGKTHTHTQDLSVFLFTIPIRKKTMQLSYLFWSFSLLHLNGCIALLKIFVELMKFYCIIVRLLKSLVYCEVVESLWERHFCYTIHLLPGYCTLFSR